MFYDILYNLCSSRGTTITKTLKTLGISTSKGTAWKNGSIPNGEILAKLADYFNVSTDYLLGNDTSKTKDPATDEEIKFALFKGSEGITDEMYEEVKRFAEMVKLRESQKKGKK